MSGPFSGVFARGADHAIEQHVGSPQRIMTAIVSAFDNDLWDRLGYRIFNPFHGAVQRCNRSQADR